MIINWYPGHMASAKRMLNENIKKVDIVIELLDARIPYSSKNPDIDDIAETKKRMIIFNKYDLCDKTKTNIWQKYYEEKGFYVHTLNSLQNNKTIIKAINNQAAELIEKSKQRGAKKVVRAMVVGIPNVGKSTFINMLVGAARARTGDKPGVTRAKQWIKINNYLELLDTPGLLWPKLEDQAAAQKLTFLGSISDNILDLQILLPKAILLLLSDYAQLLISRYKLTETKDPNSIIDEICKRRGFILKGNQYDYERCAQIVFDELQGGKLGKITLDDPEDIC